MSRAAYQDRKSYKYALMPFNLCIHLLAHAIVWFKFRYTAFKHDNKLYWRCQPTAVNKRI